MTMQSEDHNYGPQIQGLESLLRAAEAKVDAPVEAWNPPYCGDIGLKICADGSWSYQGGVIRRPQLVKLFSRVLRRDPDGRYFLVTPAEKVDVTVEDAPFLAVEMEVRDRGRDQSLIFRTNLDDVVMCDGDRPLQFAKEQESGGVKPYIRVRGQLDALVVRAVTYDLLELVQDDEGSEAGIWSGGTFFKLAADA